LCPPILAKSADWAKAFARNMAAQEFLIIGTSGMIVASVISWLVWLWRQVE
jgi:hypothetical protein